MNGTDTADSYYEDMSEFYTGPDLDDPSYYKQKENDELKETVRSLQEERRKSGEKSPLQKTIEKKQQNKMDEAKIERLQFDCSGMPDNNLIMQYVSHFTRRSDAYPEYHFLAACFIISTLIRKHAYAEFSQTTIYPNIWCMCLGASSISRKSTAIDAAETLLEDIGMGGSMPNGFSPESFIEMLSEEPHNYMLVDECGSLLSNMQKTYMTEMRDLFCKLFDNKDYCRRLRTSQRNNKTEFNVEDPYLTQMYATTPDNFSAYTNQIDLTSGWLLRFLYCNPSYEKEFMPFELKSQCLDEEYKKLVKSFKEISNIFKQNIIKFTPNAEALELYQNWQKDMETKTLKDASEIKLSGYARLSVYVLKLAMIYQITDEAFISDVNLKNHSENISECKPDYKKYEISTECMELARNHIENYFLPTFVEVSEMVARNNSRNLQDRIISILKKNGDKITRSKLMQNLHIRVKDLDPELDSLIESGEISSKNGNTEGCKPTKLYHLVKST